MQMKKALELLAQRRPETPPTEAQRCAFLRLHMPGATTLSLSWA